MLNFTESQTFKFEKQDLKEKLQLTAQNNIDGYWKIQLDRQNFEDINIYYLCLSKGNVVFSGIEPLSLSTILKTLKRYVPELRKTNTLKVIQEIQADNSDNSILLLLSKLTLKTEIVNYHKLANAVKLQILEDFDQYLFAQAGQAQFVIDQEIQDKRPIVGFKLDELIQLAEQRRKQWQQIRPWFPSANARVSCNTQNSIWQSINLQQQQRIQKLVGHNQTIEQIVYNLGEERLKVAQTLAQLAKKGLISFENHLTTTSSPVASQTATTQKSESWAQNSVPHIQGRAGVASGSRFEQAQPTAIARAAVAKKASVSTLQAQPPASTEATNPSAPEIVAVDDSPLLLRNFHTIVSGWGYRVRCCEDADKAIEVMLAGEPAVIFLDLNMPQISGFQLMKQIRLQPKLASVPLVVLTAEKTMINQQRAKWSKSSFLSKPLHPDEISTFTAELKAILQDLAPISQ